MFRFTVNKIRVTHLKKYSGVCSFAVINTYCLLDSNLRTKRQTNDAQWISTGEVYRRKQGPSMGRKSKLENSRLHVPLSYDDRI